MEPNTSYRPPYYLGQRFVDAKARKFEIIETHWGLPGSEPDGLAFTLELQSGHKIHMHGSPQHTVLQKVTFRQLDCTSAKPVDTPVEEMMEAEANRKIKFL